VDPKQGVSKRAGFFQASRLYFLHKLDCLIYQKLVYGFLWDPPFRRAMGVLHASYGTHVPYLRLGLVVTRVPIESHIPCVLRHGACSCPSPPLMPFARARNPLVPSPPPPPAHAATVAAASEASKAARTIRVAGRCSSSIRKLLAPYHVRGAACWRGADVGVKLSAMANLARPDPRLSSCLPEVWRR
jgi:hypothetical protein